MLLLCPSRIPVRLHFSCTALTHTHHSFKHRRRPLRCGSCSPGPGEAAGVGGGQGSYKDCTELYPSREGRNTDWNQRSMVQSKSMGRYNGGLELGKFRCKSFLSFTPVNAHKNLFKMCLCISLSPVPKQVKAGAAFWSLYLIVPAVVSSYRLYIFIVSISLKAPEYWNLQ